MAVAVSGGPDSMALTLLLAEWAHGRNGGVDAITIDHGLRPESTAEAQQVGRWLAPLPGVTHRILPWSGRKPETGIQAAARDARYRLLTEYCRENFILHLCLAHHRDDQIETHRLRAGHGSGTLGLAGMSALRPLDGVRMLRPLLGVAKAELRGLLVARGQAWIEDPSNRNPAFERVRLRASSEPAEAERQAASLHRLGLERQRLEADAATILAESLTLHGGGWAELDPRAFASVEPAARLAFGWILECLGGGDYPISEIRRGEALEAIRKPAKIDFTLGGCHLRHWGNSLQIQRDWGAIQDRLQVGRGAGVLWDRRFAVSVSLDAPELTIARLGERGIRLLGQQGHAQAEAGVPESARKALPALWQGDRLLAVPQLGFGSGMTARFKPAQSAASGGFTVA